jgi:hypothetical protein
MAPSRLGAVVAAAMLVLGAVGVLPGASPPAEAATSRLVLEGRRTLGIGVVHSRYSLAIPKNIVHVAHIKAGAGYYVRPTLSGNRIVGTGTSPGLETTSSMCRRTGALACVNGDFTACSGCGAPLGGVVRWGEVLRTPHPSWPQVWQGSNGRGAGKLGWSGAVTATYRWTEQVQEGATGVTVPGLPGTVEKTKEAALGLAGVNVALPRSGIVLYTPAYASSTRAPAGGFEVKVSADGRAMLTRTVSLQLVGAGSGGNATIPSNGFVLSATGAAADQLRAFYAEARRDSARLGSLTLRLRTATPVTESLGGHPVILTDGQPLPPPAADDLASRVRHPRTLMGWNDAGDVWLVTVDGRQPGYSVGVDYWESASILRKLGATDGINLDGGGSTTFVARECAGSQCVRNRPSDGRERAVTTGLAIVPRR